ncbi:MAG: hypothetical protein JWN86_3539 [Planctomycetota bacterium]|nr:hypothetical protein [Planctomycetota bacterium]
MRRESYLKLAAELIGLLAAMAAVAIFGLAKPAPKPITVARAGTPKPKTVPPQPAPVALPTAPPAAKIDEVALAKAEEDFASVLGDRTRAEARAVQAADRLRLAQARAGAATVAHRTLASTIRDPTPRLQAARSRGELLKAERDRLQGELMALNEAPRPRRKVLVDKSPVAKLSEGEEFHFEVRGDRVAFIDLERLLDRVKTDARVQLRLGNNTRSAAGTVGPVGSFLIHYEVSRVDDGSNPRMGNYGLSAWEIVPEHDLRGETFTTALGAASNFSRAIHRLNPARDVVTLWIYPDGFPLYRQLRETLHAQGFLVAARPLPAGMTIKGSPSGSASSAQ